MLDIMLYITSAGALAYSKYNPQSQLSIRRALCVVYATVFIWHAYVPKPDTGFMAFYVQDAFHISMSIGITLSAVILLLMYRADKMPIYYYRIMICVVTGAYLASKDNIVGLFIGIALIVSGLYYKVTYSKMDKHHMQRTYKKGIITAFLCMALGIGVVVLEADFAMSYRDIAIKIHQNPSAIFYLGSVLLFAGVMGLMGMVPFSTALLNVHRIFEQPLVMVNRLLVATTLFLILGHFIIVLYAYTADTFWRIIFMGVGLLSMVISVIGSMIENSLKRLYGYVVLGHMGFIAIIFSTEQVDAVALATQYTTGYVLSYLAFWAYARSVHVGRDALDKISDLAMLRYGKPYYTFWFGISALCFAGFPPFALFWGKILVLGKPEYWNQSFFEVLVILIFIQGMWALRFMYFAYIHPIPAKTRVVYTYNASSMTGIMRILLTGFAILYVFI